MATEPINNVDSSLVNITIRMIMQGKEVGSIIGKKGDNIKKIRIESGAKINISDGNLVERIVTVTGPIRTILKAFSFIAQKFEEQNAQNNPGKSLVTLKLIVPASQCGSLIGKGGSKIKEIREVTGASIQVASEMLTNSTERTVTLAGNAESITKCIYQICSVMIESPAKGTTIPYRPKAALAPVLFAGGQAYTIQGQYAVHQPDLTKLHQLALQHAPLVATGHNVGSLNPQVASLVAANSLRSNAHVAQAVLGVATPTTTNMSIPNEVIGCIIGKGGSKINEIRQLSGANIKITNQENGLKYRTVSITGTSESINLAQYLIHSSMEMHKSLTIDQNNLAHQTTSVTQITAASTSSSLNNINTIPSTTNGQQDTNVNNVASNGTASLPNSSAMIVDDPTNDTIINSSSESNNITIQTTGSGRTSKQQQQQQQVNQELTGITKGINGNSASSHRPNTPNSKTSAKAVRKYAPY